MLSRIFKPNYLYDLLRIGSKNDGGYLVERQSLEKTEFLLSFGISTNWDFEEDFIKFKNLPHNLDNPNRLKSPEINLEFNE